MTEDPKKRLREGVDYLEAQQNNQIAQTQIAQTQTAQTIVAKDVVAQTAAQKNNVAQTIIAKDITAQTPAQKNNVAVTQMAQTIVAVDIVSRNRDAITAKRLSRVDAMTTPNLKPLPTWDAGYDSSGRRLVQTLGQDPVAVGRPVSTGAIGTGDRTFNTGSAVDVIPHIKPVPPVVVKSSKNVGIVMCLDTNWGGLGGYGDPLPLITILRYFKKSVIYALPDSDTRLYSGSYQLTSSILPPSEFTIIKSGISAAKGFFFLSLLNPNATLTGAEFKKLKDLSKSFGIFVVGEWASWVSHDNRLLRGLNVDPRISVPSSTPFNNSYTFTGKIQGLPFEGNAQGVFEGLREEEVLVTNEVGAAVFALIKAR
jgi:hypothetical protein